MNTSFFLSAASADPLVQSSFDEDVMASAAAEPRPAAVAAGGFGGFAGCLRRLLQQSKQRSRSRTRRSTNNEHPTAMAMTAVLESLLRCFRGDGGVAAGDGAGEGKNGVQGSSGLPQRARFPANAGAGNLDRFAGIGPLRRLFDTLKLRKPLALMLGSSPEKLLFSRNRPVKLARLLMANGIWPEKPFDEMSSRTSWVSRVSSGRNSPVNALCWR